MALQNKILLNYPKTNFMVINKYSHKSVSTSFNLNLNVIALKRVETIKYLRISIDEMVTWTFHITQLTLQLSKFAGLFYRLRSYVARETLCILYYTLVYTKITVQYEIIVWATANKTSLGFVKVKLNKILRIILSCSKFTLILTLYKTLNFLQLEDIYLLELAKFMYQLYHRKLPQKFYVSFSKLTEIHNYNIYIYYIRIPHINKNFSKNLLSNSCSILVWGQIDAEFKSMQWVSFKKNYKNIY